MIFKIIITKGEDDYYVANCPSLKSCWSQGLSKDEALKNIREAIELYLEPPSNSIIQDSTHEVVNLAI